MFHHSHPHPHVHLLRWRAHRAVHHVVAGVGLVLLGIGFLLREQGRLSTTELWLIAPLVIALTGVARLVVDPGVGSLLRALFRLAVAAYLVVVILHVGGWTFAATWPVLLIAVGAAQVGHALFWRRALREPTW